MSDSDGWVLAVDFGTSFTTAAMAALGDENAAEVLEVDRSRYMPSAVVLDEAGELVTGRSAVRQAMVFPDRAERVPKRALAVGDRIVLGGQPVTVADLAGAVLRRVYREAVARWGGVAPAVVVLTHPARWEEEELRRLRAAAARAGIGDPVLVAEPVAAAWRYARPSAGAVVAVFDLGGGTLDTAVLQAGTDGYELAGPPGGDAALGGEDFDEALLGRVGETAAERDEAAWDALSAGADVRARRERARLRLAVIEAKEELSQVQKVDLEVAGFPEPFRVTRPELEELIGPTVDRAVAEMAATLAAAGVAAEELSGVFLTGGSSLVPLVSQRLGARLGVLPRLLDDPKAVVALGAIAAVTSGGIPGAAARIAAAVSLREADRLLAEHRFAAAEAACWAALAEDRGLALAHAKLGRALSGQDRDDQAEAACREALRLDPSCAEAHAVLGAVLTSLKRYDEARAALQQAIGSGHPEVARRATLSLAGALRGQEDFAAARAAYQQLIDSEDPDFAPRAEVGLGGALKAQGDLAGARAAYERAIGSGHFDATPRASFLLGVLLKEQGDAAGAQAAYRQVIDSGHPDLAVRASFLLGVLLQGQGDVAGAGAAFQRTVDSGHPKWSSWGAAGLAEVLEKQRDVAGARAAYQRAVDSGEADVFPRAAFWLGQLLKAQGDLAGARAAYQRAIDSGHSDAAPHAAFRLGALLQGQGDLAGARAAYQRAIDSGHQDWSPWAAAGLGEVLQGQGDLAGARAAYQRAIGSGHSEAGPRSLCWLGWVLNEHGDVAGARAALQRAVDSGHADAAPQAACLLGALLADQGDVAGARAAFQRAVDSGHADWSSAAADALSKLEG
jgi:tetratricopeptide (TPR) repeat protein/actin-like ATPase involved in cell morphogenesis